MTKITVAKENKLKRSDCKVVPIPKKKKKKSPLQKRKDKASSGYWKNKASAEWGKLIHLRDNVCAVNNKDCKGKLEAHHLISKSQVLIRNKTMNGILLCSNHHKFSEKCSPHKGPIGFTIWLQVNRPGQYRFVQENRYLTGKKPDYKADYEYLKMLVDNYANS